MKNKIFNLIATLNIIIFLALITGFTTGYFPTFRPFGNSTTFTDSSGYVTLNTGWKVRDSLFVNRDGYVKGALYLDTNRQGKIFFSGQDLVLGNYKSGGFVSVPLPLVVSGTSSFIGFPQLTATQRDDLVSSGVLDFAGAVIWNSDATQLQVYDGSNWLALH